MSARGPKANIEYTPEREIKRPISSKTNPVGSGRYSCRGFPAVHERIIVNTPTARTCFDDFSGVFQLSSQGIRPFRLKVNRYQETYQNPRPVIPIIPKVKDSESHGPGNEKPRNIVLRIRREPMIAGTDPLTSVSFATTLPIGICPSNRLSRKVIHRFLLAEL